jgi:hypothetical protein
MRSINSENSGKLGGWSIDLFSATNHSMQDVTAGSGRKKSIN